MNSKEVRSLRFELRLTQAELAKAVGISQAQISKIERGETEPDFRLISYLKRSRDEKTYDGSIPKLCNISLYVHNFDHSSYVTVSGNILDGELKIPFSDSAYIDFPYEFSPDTEDVIKRISEKVAKMMIDKAFRLGASRVADIYRSVGERVKEISAT